MYLAIAYWSDVPVIIGVFESYDSACDCIMAYCDSQVFHTRVCPVENF